MKRKILHITPWFPSEAEPFNALWIQRHIDSLNSRYENHIIHLEIRSGRGQKILEKQVGLDIDISFSSMPWYLKEWQYYRKLKKILRKIGIEQYDLVNFHIAYPSCVYLMKLSRKQAFKSLITEHWSYYHFHFYSKQKLKRIKRIFHMDIPLITVSKRLNRDISEFCGKEMPLRVVPNVVDTEVFNYNPNREVEPYYLMAGFWKSPKKPLTVIADYLSSDKKENLKIAGYGPQWDAMIEMANDHPQIEFLGPLKGHDLAKEMQGALAFLMPSEYETFSVITAEALCCGTPILISDGGALPELLTETNGQIITSGKWFDSVDLLSSLDRKKISLEASEKFNKKKVGELYSKYIEEVLMN